MRFLVTFLEGIVSFLSPCMLPMLPVYLTYFAGNSGRKGHTLSRAAGFTAGFTAVFALLGLFVGTLGSLLSRYRVWVDIVCGAMMVLFGLSILEILPMTFLKGIKGKHEVGSVLSAAAFGMIYALNLTPCVGAYLGAALMMAASAGGAVKGLLLLTVYALGLGIPFLLSAVLIDRLKGVFSFIKRHYRVIDLCCGIFLIIVGIAIAAGVFNRLMAVIG